MHPQTREYLIHAALLSLIAAGILAIQGCTKQSEIDWPTQDLTPLTEEEFQAAKDQLRKEIEEAKRKIEPEHSTSGSTAATATPGAPIIDIAPPDSRPERKAVEQEQVGCPRGQCSYPPSSRVQSRPRLFRRFR
jgi:hypothetical protein